MDAETLRYLRFTGRPEQLIRLVEAYTKEQGLFHTTSTPEALYSDVLELDLGAVEPSLAGPKRPQDRVRLGDVKKSFAAALPGLQSAAKPKPAPIPVQMDIAKEINEGSPVIAPAHIANGGSSPAPLHHGSVVIAAITSCTNTSNPSVMVAAGLVAKKAVEKGLNSKPWVKTSLAPGSKVVTDYLNDAGLTPYLEQLRFHLVGYGCTTCIGNSGPLPAPVSKSIEDNHLVAAAVLSGNRNFEGRVHPEVRANYLASPPLVVAYALAGSIDVDLKTEPLGTGKDGKPVYLKDIWPTQREVSEAVAKSVRSEMFTKEYGEVYKGDATWQSLPVPEGDQYQWNDASTYIKHAPYFETMAPQPDAVKDVKGAVCWRCWATASRPTTFRRPARSRRTARPAST